MSRESDSIINQFILSLICLLGSLTLAFSCFFYFNPKIENITFFPRQVFIVEEDDDSTSDFQATPYRVDPTPPKALANNYGNTPTKEVLPELSDLFQKGKSELKNGNVEDALSIFLDILKKDPTNEKALIEVGLIYLVDLQNPNLAQDFLERALTVNPGNKSTLSDLVAVYQEIDNLEAGNQFLRNLLDQDPDNLELAEGIAQMLLDQDKPDEASTYFEKIARNGTPEAKTQYADSLSEAGHHEQAGAVYRSVIDIEKEKWQNGAYAADPEKGRDNVMAAFTNYFGDLLFQGQAGGDSKQTMNELIEEFKSFFGDNEQAMALLEHLPK